MASNHVPFEGHKFFLREEPNSVELMIRHNDREYCIAMISADGIHRMIGLPESMPFEIDGDFNRIALCAEL